MAKLHLGCGKRVAVPDFEMLVRSHMDKEHGLLMSLNVQAIKPRRT